MVEALPIRCRVWTVKLSTSVLRRTISPLTRSRDGGARSQISIQNPKSLPQKGPGGSTLHSAMGTRTRHLRL